MFSDNSIITIIFWLVALFASITFHEFMHAWSANYLGDPTAKLAGRVSLNPLAHVDIFGTVLVPLLLILVGGPVFGWAKPVPINPNNFKNYRKGEVLTSIAGPMANLILLLVFSLIYRLLPNKESLFGILVLNFVVINTILMVFNLIPIPPLDGSKILYGFLPFETIRKIEVYGPFFLIPFIFLFAPAVLGPIVNLVLSILGIGALF